MVHFYRNVFTAVPNNKVKEVAGMLKAIHAQEDRDAALVKATAIVERLESMKLSKAAGIVRKGIAETLSHYYFPRTSLLTKNAIDAVFVKKVLSQPLCLICTIYRQFAKGLF